MIPLSDLQAGLARLFGDYDIAAGDLDTVSCVRIRREICAVARQEIRKLTQLNSPGLYLFANTKEKGFGALVYIGLAKGQDGAKRLADYLTADISTLDRRLTEMEDDMARQTIKRRLAATMPATAQATLDSYVHGHMKARRISFASAIFFARSEDPPARIENAETLLVSTAHHAGASLVNAVKRRWPPPIEAVAGAPLASATIEEWVKSGLGGQLGEPWQRELELAVEAAAGGRKMQRDGKSPPA